MSEGKFFYGKLGNMVVIKPVGIINYKTCPFFDRFITHLFEDTDTSGYLIDLTRTTYIDSTTLGLLAKMQKHSLEHFGKRPTVISSDPAVDEILKNLGFDQLFEIVNYRPDTEEELDTIPEDGPIDQRDIGQVMLKAHRCLMEIDEKNASKFRNVVNLLEEELRVDDDD